MTLNEYAARQRMTIYEELRAGLAPSSGSYDAALLKEAKSKGLPQMGTTRYEPHAMLFEFIYPDPLGSPVIVTVRLESQERIVFMPVPTWVVENIWQGDIAGTHHFETEAGRLMQELEGELSPEGNLRWFERQPAKRRE